MHRFMNHLDDLAGLDVVFARASRSRDVPRPRLGRPFLESVLAWSASDTTDRKAGRTTPPLVARVPDPGTDA